MRWGLRHAIVFGVLSTLVGGFVACKTYGAASSVDPASDSGPEDNTRPDSSTVMITVGDASAPSQDASDASADAAPDGPPCPPCPPSATCLAAGCVSADSTANSCTAPKDIGATSQATLFVCPDGPQVTLPSTCNGGGTFHVGMIRLAAGSWAVAAAGSNPFLATDNCTTVTACYGDITSVGHVFSGPSTVLIGTTNALTACETVSLTVTER